MSDFGYDGPTLRSLRESSGVTLRKVARQADMSHGHLSKVERGEPGRLVTPKVLHAYERATGIKLTGKAGHTNGAAPEGGWRRGHLSDARRRALRAKVAAIAAGGQLGEGIGRILDGTGRLLAPAAVEKTGVAHLEQVAAFSTMLDMRYGGEVAGQLTRAQLKWAIGLLDSSTSRDVEPRLHAAVGALAHRAGWAAFDADSHDVARDLFTVGLYAATHADDPNLRAHILTDIAAQANFLGYPDDCLYIARQAEVDERVRPAVRMAIHAAKARAYALQGNDEACRQQVELAERAHVDARGEQVEGWPATVATSAHLHAGTGHALATLARRTNSDGAGGQARHRLAAAVDELDPVNQARAAALCLAQLTALHLEAGELGECVHVGRQLLDIAGGIRSSRLTDHLTVVRRTAGIHTHEVMVKQLVTELDARLSTAAEGTAIR